MEAPSLSPGSIGSKPSWDSGSHGTTAGSCPLQKERIALLIAEFQGTVMSSAQNTHSTLPPIQEDNFSYMLVTRSQVLVWNSNVVKNNQVQMRYLLTLTF